MQQAGLSAAQVLHSATGASAARVGTPRISARLLPAPSRFLLTEHEVLADVAHLRRPKAVIFDGAVHTTVTTPPCRLYPGRAHTMPVTVSINSQVAAFAEGVSLFEAARASASTSRPPAASKASVANA